jgi:hypothetical protein
MKTATLIHATTTTAMMAAGLFASSLSSTAAFSTCRPSLFAQQQPRRITVLSLAEGETGKSYFATPVVTNHAEMEKDNNDSKALEVVDVVNPYQQIGIEEDQLAIGVDPNEFLKYVGT